MAVQAISMQVATHVERKAGFPMRFRPRRSRTARCSCSQLDYDCSQYEKEPLGRSILPPPITKKERYPSATPPTSACLAVLPGQCDASLPNTPPPRRDW